MFAILGIEKHKTRATISARASHHLRGHDVPNADPALAHKNACTWKGDVRGLVDEVWRVTEPAMQRKDGIRLVELMLSASPEWFKENGGPGRTQDLVTGARAFVNETFGAANVVAAGVHMDEKTPHFWVFLTPIFEGKLRASRWLDGPEKLQKLHTDWAAKMAPFGLKRGVKKSGAKHVAVRTYYAAVNGNPAAQESIAREMSRRSLRAQKRAEEAELKAQAAERRVAEIEALGAKNQAVFEALDAEAQKRAAGRFASAQPTTPSPGSEKPPVRPPMGPVNEPLTIPKNLSSPK